MLLNIVFIVTGTHFKPTLPAYFLNEDYSSQYYFAGNSGKDSQNNNWLRVKTELLVNRSKDSIWSNIDSTNELCKGIHVKYACGGSDAGSLYPICIIISGLSNDKLPKEKWVVISIEELSINGHIYPRNREVDYMYLVGSHVL